MAKFVLPLGRPRQLWPVLLDQMKEVLDEKTLVHDLFRLGPSAPGVLQLLKFDMHAVAWGDVHGRPGEWWEREHL